MNVAYYGFGGGHGHAVRGLAVLRRLRARLPHASLTLLAPARHRAWAEHEGVRLLSPPEPTDPDRLRAWVTATLDATAPDLICVDVFPRGVLGELRLDGRRAWLVSRWVRPDYYLAPDVRAAIERDFTGVAWGEAPPPELSALQVRQEIVPPMLVRSAQECANRTAARKRLGVDATAPLVLALAPDDDERRHSLGVQLERWCAARPRVVLRVLDGTAFPAMEILRAADVVVGGGGYHAVHETRALGVRAIHIPEPRRYDDQFHRAAWAESSVASPFALERALDAAFAAGPAPQPTATSDGATALVDLMLKATASHRHAADDSRPGTDRSGDIPVNDRAP